MTGREQDNCRDGACKLLLKGGWLFHKDVLFPIHTDCCKLDVKWLYAWEGVGKILSVLHALVRAACQVE